MLILSHILVALQTCVTYSYFELNLQHVEAIQNILENFLVSQVFQLGARERRNILANAHHDTLICHRQTGIYRVVHQLLFNQFSNLFFNEDCTSFPNIKKDKHD